MKYLQIIVISIIIITSFTSQAFTLSERDVLYPEEEFKIDNYFLEIHNKIQFFTKEKQKITYQRIYDSVKNYKESHDIADTKTDYLINYIISKTNRKLTILSGNITIVCALWGECDDDEKKY